MRRRKRRTQVLSAFSRAGLLPSSELIVSKRLITLLFRDELPEILQDSPPFYCFPRKPTRRAAIRGKRQIFLSKA